MTRVILGGNDYDTDDPDAPLLLGGNLGVAGGGSVVRRTSAPAAEDMADPSAVLWIDVLGSNLQVTWLVGGDYGTLTLVTLAEV